MNKSVVLLAAIFLTHSILTMLAWSAPGSTTRRREVRHRQARQSARIQQGVHRGELTKEEAQHLRSEEKNIRAAKHEALSDGHMSREEAADINKMQNNASHDIYEEKHDAEKR